MGILEHQARRRYFLEPGFWRACESTSLEVQPSGSLRGSGLIYLMSNTSLPFSL
jgi:hypothetical protein